MKVLVLLAGDSKLFKESNYIYPKYLIEVNGKPLVQHVIQSLSSFKDSEFIFLIRKEEDERYFLGNVIRLLLPKVQVIPIENQTCGAACSSLLAIEEINNDEPLVITNGDQIVKTDFDKAIKSFQKENLDGGIITFDSVHPKWSYVRTDENGYVIETAEKRPLSRQATAGMYYFKHGKDFVDAAMNMIRKDARINNSYYVCPTYNEMILQQKKIKAYQIKRENYISLSTPEHLNNFQKMLEKNPKIEMETL